jgi:hypothetical protein
VEQVPTLKFLWSASACSTNSNSCGVEKNYSPLSLLSGKNVSSIFSRDSSLLPTPPGALSTCTISTLPRAPLLLRPSRPAALARHALSLRPPHPVEVLRDLNHGRPRSPSTSAASTPSLATACLARCASLGHHHALDPLNPPPPGPPRRRVSRSAACPRSLLCSNSASASASHAGASCPPRPAAPAHRTLLL